MRKFFIFFLVIIITIHLILLICYHLLDIVPDWYMELGSSGEGNILVMLLLIVIMLILLIPVLLLVCLGFFYKYVYLDIGFNQYSVYIMIIGAGLWLISELICFIQYLIAIKEDKEREKQEQIKRVEEEINRKKQKILDEKRARESNRRNKFFQSIMKLYKEVTHVVNLTKSIPLIMELEEIYRYLNSENLKIIKNNGTSDDFNEIINSITDDLQELKKLANKYQSDEETEYHTDETEEGKAYRILNIPPTANNEQIKKQYRHLSLLWHPDKKLAENDIMFKNIDWAYRLLIKKKK